MKKVYAEKYRDIDFSRAKRGPVIPLEPGKTKISIRLDNRVLDYFRGLVEKAGGGNYQTLINDALVAYIEQRSMIEAVRLAVRQELKSATTSQGLTRRSTGPAASGGPVSAAREADLCQGQPR
jgi:uncharacterized protein (DUF4415 family)